jgi:predicted nuclease of predicted toxin-antitoxin system
VKLLLDQDVPRRAAALLREAGVDAVHASEVGLSSADDGEIVAWCRVQGSVAVTLDADIHALVALSGQPTPSTIRIRVQGLKGPEVAGVLSNVLATRRDALATGALITVQPGRLRVRHLPITREAM